VISPRLVWIDPELGGWLPGNIEKKQRDGREQQDDAG
jgi:hypothetical protein